MIKSCVIMPWDGESACQTIIDKAQENIDTILKPNIRQILEKLNDKIKENGALIYSGYAPFFSTANEDCSDPDKQEWALKSWRWWQFWNWLNKPLRLTVERRTKFNTLVENINKAIFEVVEEFDKDTKIKYRATFSDWSSWPGIVDGQFCSPSSSGAYPDPKQPELLFIKMDTRAVAGHDPDQLKRRGDNNGTELLDSGNNNGPESVSEADDVEDDDDSSAMRQHVEEYRDRLKGRLTREHIHDSLLYKSANPRAEVLHKLDARAPTPPGCPGDGLPGVPLGLGLPDSFLSIFHPNTKGHEAMAAYALQNLIYLRAQILGVDDGTCALTRDDFTCWQKEGRKAFVSWDRLNENYKDFCNDVKPPDNTINWKWEKTYHKGTPDEHTFSLQLTDGTWAFDKAACLESFDRIINSCDGNDPNNPLNLKFGGRWVRGNYNYQYVAFLSHSLSPLFFACVPSWKLIHHPQNQPQAGARHDHQEGRRVPRLVEARAHDVPLLRARVGVARLGPGHAARVGAGVRRGRDGVDVRLLRRAGLVRGVRVAGRVQHARVLRHRLLPQQLGRAPRRRGNVRGSRVGYAGLWGPQCLISYLAR
jgi:hypothetical protein